MLNEGYGILFAQIGGLLGEVRGDTGISGLKLDFNDGLRLQVPEGNWHVHIHDYFYEEDVQKMVLVALEKYFIHWQIDVYLNGRMVFSHQFDPTVRRYILSLPAGDW